MAASDYINNVYNDAKYYAGRAELYATTVASSVFGPNPDYLFGELTKGATSGGDTPNRIERLETQPNYNIAFTTQGSPDIATPLVNAPAVPQLSESLSNISDFSDVVIPDFLAAAPALNFPTEINLANPDAPSNKPSIDHVALPDAPVLDLPTLPTLADIPVPDDVNVVIPSFALTFEEQRPTAPINTFAHNEQEYNSNLLTSALDLLEQDIKEGGYGIDESGETAIWNRAKDRISRASEDERIEADTNLSSRGFTLPIGAQNALHARAAQNKTTKLAEVNSDIAIKHVDMRVQARQFAITTGLNAQQFLINFHNVVQERSLRANEILANLGIAHFNTNLAVYQAGLDTYRTKADVFRIELDAAKQSLDIYLARLEAARLKSQLNKDQIELYNAQYQAVEALINVYNTQLQAARVKAELEELKLRVYSEENKIFTAQLQADGQRIENYKALAQTEGLKMDAYRTQAQAYGAVLDGAKVRAGVQNDKISAQVKKSELKLKEYEANITTWDAQYRNALKNAEIVMQKHGVDVDKWRETQRLNMNKEELGLRSHDANIKNMVNVTNSNLDLYKLAIGSSLDMFGRVTGNIAKTADLQSDLATSQINALNMIAGVIE